MKLYRLTCSNSKFRPLEFNHTGLSIIKGTRSEDMDGRVNGVGKSLAAKIVDFCLGGEKIEALSRSIPDWIFRLSFFVNGHEHIIERSANGKITALDEKSFKHKELTQWFNENGPFVLPELNIPDTIKSKDKPTITYRSLISRFLRTDNGKDFSDPLKTHADITKEALAILRNLYILGVDCDPAIRKITHKIEIDAEKNRIDTLLRDNVVRNILRAGTTPEITLGSLSDDILKLQEDIDKFEIAEDYRELESVANELTLQSREITRQVNIIDYQLSNIEEMLKETPDITSKDLLGLYNALSSTFTPEILDHFAKVEEFHFSLSRNRIARLNEDKNTLLTKKQSLLSENNIVVKRKDAIISQIKGKRALDEYVAMTQRLATLKEEYNRLNAFLEFKNEAETRRISLKASMAQDNNDVFAYITTKPLSVYDHKFRELARILYPGEKAGIDLQNNTGENQKRFDLLVELEAQSSTGVSEAKIVIYDWLLLTMGVHHTMGFLWHDSKLFANMDDVARAEWYKFVLRASVQSGKQYIISINTEAYDSTVQKLEETTQKVFSESVIVDLCGGNDDSGRLLGTRISDMKIS